MVVPIPLGHIKTSRISISADASCSADAVDIIFYVFRQVVIDYMVNLRNIQTSGANICGNQVRGLARSKFA